MRLHQLSITAFGPFPDTVEVDFDALASGGVFLLTGATGAGKTSVLDAVCFALYGQVPGDRAGAKHLRSDHAPPDREPRVVLDLSVGARRFRFTRSPAWARPKRRGSGFTSAPAHVVVEEMQDGSWHALTNRLEDAGLLVGDLLGMNCTQFTQVAMLPQGRFQAFLRATSVERHDVLQKLFRTDRFERVERWLVERRIEARRASEASEAQVRAVLTRLEESGAAAAPPAWADTLDAAETDGRIAAWMASLAGSAAEAVTDAEAELTRAESVEAEARQALDAVRAQIALLERVRGAELVLRDYEASAQARTATRDRLEAARRAAPLDPLVTRAQAARAAAGHAIAAWRRRRHQLIERFDFLDADPSRADLVAARSDAAAAHAAAVAFLPRDRELHQLTERHAATEAALAEHRAALSAAQAELTALPEQVELAEKRRRSTAEAAARLTGARERVAGLEITAQAVRRAAEVEAELVVARDDLRAATDHAQATREAYLDVREARISGMAAELAGGLAAGCNCPVCGSADHPAPARTANAVGRDEEAAARKLHEDAAITELGHQGRVAGLEAESATLATQLDGVDRDGVADALTQARVDAEITAAQAADAPTAAQEAATLRTALADARDRVNALGLRCATEEAELVERAATLAALVAERAALLGDDADDVERLVEHRAHLVTIFDAALQDLDATRAASDAADDAAAALAESAREAGFAGADEVTAAVLSTAETAELAERLQSEDATAAAARALLDDPEVAAARLSPATDRDVVAHTHAEAAKLLRVAVSALAAARNRHQRLGELDQVLLDALAAWEPLRARHRVLAELAGLVEGRSVDNPLRMRLTAYVLAERLRQVVAAANERLHGMTGARFSLEHTLDRGVGEQRGGLSLRIRDDWNGVERDPATLSGGETFVVSLALALGLADTVAHEAGGADIDTLFIDEGFGSLDADTLEDVMDTLDTLRDGGRVVGLVSHVPELRSRITAQLEVRKGRAGSTLRPQVAAG